MKTRIRKLLAPFVAALIACTGSSVMPANADHENAVRIKVGGYPFEPFVEDGRGITADFLALLNRSQQDIHFELVSIPSQRRYELMRREIIDAVFFEMPVWGWQDYQAEIDVSSPILRGTEIFVARRQEGSGAAVFQLSPERKVAVTLGYHYAFADFNADQKHVRTVVDAVFAEKISQTLRYLRTGAVDLAVMSDIYLLSQYQRTPQLKSELAIGPVPDHDYALPIILHKNAPVTALQIDKLIEKLRTTGALTDFFSKYGIESLLLGQ